MLKKIITPLLLLSLTAFATTAQAKECYQLKENSFSVNWKAFKTPAKVGVGGSFTDYDLQGKAQASSLAKLLKGFKIDIKTDKNSVDTNNQGRDYKIANYFFSTMEDNSIVKGQITKVTNKDLSLRLSMNGVTKDIPMNYTLDGKSFEAYGIIDVFDFKLATELMAINKACEALHEGKTWNDVEVTLKAEIDPDC